MPYRSSARVSRTVQETLSLLSLQERTRRDVPIEALAGRLGMQVEPGDFGLAVVGFLMIRPDPVIVFNSRMDRPRQRFTIAHELGHYLLHRRDVGYFMCNDRSQNWREREANQFAADVLMPEDLVVATWPEVRQTKWMATFFAVSELAMGRRLGELGLKEPANLRRPGAVVANKGGL
ncbi:MAG TPA: ImmA/IrrE family metallo-endopeptidase [Bacillota bacterium]